MNLAGISIRRPVFATMLIMAFMVFGIVAYPKVGVDLFPEVDFPVVTVRTVYPGTDPATMEREVAKPIEEAVSAVGGIKALKSTNLEGVSFVAVQFELEVPADKALQEVRNKVSGIVADLPKDADPPVVEKFDVGAAPIMTLALYGQRETRDLTRLADKVVKARLQQIRGIGAIEIIGGQERQLQVFVEPDHLAAFSITVEDVANAIRAQNMEMPAGTLKAGAKELTVTTRADVKSAQELASIRIPGSPNPNLKLGDVARVVDAAEEATSSSYFDGAPAVTLSVQKQSGANTVAVASEVRKAIVDLEPQLKKASAELKVATDNSVFIEHSINDVQFDLIFGSILAVLVIYLFLFDIRATFISAVAIPTSVVATFAFIQYMGFTFNNMTMLALSLAIGILVDDAIVVMENIHRHLEEGKPPMQAAAEGTQEIVLPVIAMTSTIVAVFVPVAVMRGIVGRFFLQFGLTVAFSVIMSMIVSFTLTPMMSSRLLKLHDSDHKWLPQRIFDAGMDWLGRVYAGVIRWALRWHLATVGLALAAFLGSFFLIAQVPSEFVPPEDQSRLQLDVELDTGASLEETTKLCRAIAADLRENGPGVTHTSTTVGGGQQGQSNKGLVQVLMVKPDHRGFTQQDLQSWIRARYSGVKHAQLTVGEIEPVSGGGDHTELVQFAIRGDDLEAMDAAARKLVSELKQVEGFVDLKTTYESGKPEVEVNIDRERAAALGVPVASVATTVRAFLAGDRVSQLKDGGDAYDIIVRLPEQQRERIVSPENLKVRNSEGELVDLADVVSIKRATGPAKIEREARQRQITVLANLDGMPLGTAKDIVQEKAARIVPPQFDTRFTGMAEIMADSFVAMIEALLIAIILVYMILAAQFDSFTQPIVIMISLPLSVVGAFGGLYITGMTLSIFSMIGVIMLMGLVTKNAILLVDFANELRGKGMKLKDALVRAGELRLRPILMTAISLIFGMLPVALALGEGGETRAPMAVCVMGGMIASTLLTLVVVPVVYMYFDALGGFPRWLGSFFSRSAPKPASTVAEEAAE